MSKKTRQQKEMAHLRRELERLRSQMRAPQPSEILETASPRPVESANRLHPDRSHPSTVFRFDRARAQQQSQGAAQEPASGPSPSVTSLSDPHLKRDLLKTFVLSGVSLTAILLLYFLQTRRSLF